MQTCAPSQPVPITCIGLTSARFASGPRPASSAHPASLLAAALQQLLQQRLQQRQQAACRLLPPPPLLRCRALAALALPGCLVGCDLQRQLIQLVCCCVRHPAESFGVLGARWDCDKSARGCMASPPVPTPKSVHPHLKQQWPHRSRHPRLKKQWPHRSRHLQAPSTRPQQASTTTHLAVPVTCAPSSWQAHLNSMLSSKPARFLPRTSHWCASPLQIGRCDETDAVGRS